MSKSLEIGIVGLPNAGKSTLFNALTKSRILAANYPFATIEPNTGFLSVPDPRLAALAKLYDTEKIIEATVKVVDIAGLVKGASDGEGLGNKFLSHIRECNAICHVVRAFKDGGVTHVNNQEDPKNDIEIVNTELVLADLQTVTKSLPASEKLAKSDLKLQPLVSALRLAKACLEDNKLITSNPEIEIELLAQLNLLTTKPMLYVFNVDENTLRDTNSKQSLAKLTGGAKALFINAQIESDLIDFREDEAKELLSSYGESESGLEKVINAMYDTLGLQSYLTAGPKEVRAWTIKKGSTAPQAAGVIHTDFERGFISAEIVSYDDLIDAGSYNEARTHGKVRKEGKDYVMQPDDVVDFKFNV